ncbi:MAG: type II secretion system GspH family protein [Proteobacteria bacterium]|jgi:type II secretory pathway pseudopilin PulG|nr:type II secretion system GspH family protein [Pseudomonadota bacterium]MCG2745539.1 type II secretion system GspH family protein [Desulfobacteraceae bacterium]MBU4029510.1 type II secretion system GspH family protein [Pseudomonadota bacterium]MBU4043286.1 type II secretion system GspH family protein [Pseudomonadota bacterium]MBU4107868.1 type II secretion system GspH family protein [Pseudomonadota bacterium]
MAIVLVIVGLMLGGLMMSLTQTRESTNRSEAVTQLAETEEALYGFAQANGRLPCPATPTSNGAEAPVGGGVCTLQHGFVPSVTLGLRGSVNDDGLLLDPWNNPLRYSVTTANGNAFTTSSQIKTVGMTALIPNLRVCREAACTNQITTTAPAIVLSMGKNWATFTHADEVANAGEATTTLIGPSGLTYRIGNNNDFVSAGYSETNFDDLITWLSPNILYAKMFTANQLP